MDKKKYKRIAYVLDKFVFTQDKTNNVVVDTSYITDARLGYVIDYLSKELAVDFVEFVSNNYTSVVSLFSSDNDYNIDTDILSKITSNYQNLNGYISNSNLKYGEYSKATLQDLYNDIYTFSTN